MLINHIQPQISTSYVVNNKLINNKKNYTTSIKYAPYNLVSNSTADSSSPSEYSIKLENIIANSNISFKSSISEHIGQGARYLGNGNTKFTLTTPYADSVAVKIIDETKGYDNLRTEYLEKNGSDKFSKVIGDTKPGDKYIYSITKNGKTTDLYDPRADYLPYDILDYTPKANLAEIIDHNKFQWTDKEWMKNRKSSNEGYQGWGIPKNTILESIHIGLLGGFKEAKKELDKIAENKVANAVRLMPIGEFYGEHNWGYDEVAKYAVENAYGSPDEFKDFVNYAHEKGIKVILDVVPNHFGSYGAVLQEFIPTYNNEKTTPWGSAIKFNGEDGKYMLSYINDMLVNWAVNYHVDGFRFDAMHHMESDEGVREVIKDLRSHDETKDLILYPEDMRISRTIANSNLDKNVTQQNWGYSGQTTFDFFKSLIANVTKETTHGIKPSIQGLEYLYRNGVFQSHEENMLKQPNIDPNYKAYCMQNMNLPSQNADNMLINVSNPDEIGNDVGGKRNIATILASRLNMYERLDGNWQQAQWLTFDMLMSYVKEGHCLDEDTQRLYGVKDTIARDLFDKELKNAFELNKLMLGAMFMHPSPKEFFMGDDRAEFSPLKFFCEMPKTAINPKTKQKFIYEIAREKGYMPDVNAFNESKIRQEKYNAKWMEEGTQRFSSDFAELLRKLPVFETCDLDKVCTCSNIQKDVLEIKRYDNYGHEVIAVMNFSDKGYDNFELNTTDKKFLKEEINSKSTKYNGSGQYINGEYCNSKDLKIPPYSIVVFSPVEN